jgi:hypothetical protein
VRVGTRIGYGMAVASIWHLASIATSNGKSADVGARSHVSHVT